MASRLINPAYQRLLLVEGEDDKAFFLALARHLKLDHTVQVVIYESSTKLRGSLSNLVADPHIETIRAIGIVRDADYNTNAFDSIRSAIRHANNIRSDFRLPMPEKPDQWTDEIPRVGALILPSSNLEGMLEDVVLNAYAEDPVMQCVDQYLGCLQATIGIKQNLVPKGKLRTYLVGKVIDERSTKGQKDDWELSHVYGNWWWSWAHPEFERPIAFLQALATV